jgi:anti-sigma-K factor RskA
MIPVKQIDPEDLPLYAMNLLPSDEMEELTQNLQYSREARRQLTEIYEELSFYAHSVGLEAPDPAAKQRLMKQIAREKKVVSIDRAQAAAPAAPVVETVYVEKKRGAATKVLPWLGWAAAACISLAAGRLYQQNESLNGSVSAERTALANTTNSAEMATRVMDIFRDPAAQNVVLTSSAVKPPPEARLAYNAEKGSLVFLATSMAAIAADKTYELWLIPANGHGPIPAGTFRPDAQGYASVILPELPKGVVAAQFGVTLEKEGGSTTPTMPILIGGKPA